MVAAIVIIEMISLVLVRFAMSDMKLIPTGHYALPPITEESGSF
jgi:hypothetical protein